MGKILLAIGIVLFVSMVVINVVLWYSLKMGCTDYLKLTGDAPNIEKAHQFLGEALHYIEQHHLTSGNSAIFFHTPSADLGVWYGQLKGAQATLEKILQKDNQGSMTQLERDNALMKVREVVIDEGKEGVRVTTPPNLSWYPNQGVIFFFWICSALVLAVGAFWVVTEP